MPGRKKIPRGGKAAAAPEVVNPNVNRATDGATTPDRGPPFPIVAIGASAGGIEAMGSLLRALPADTGMAFVLILHLSPTHESLLAEILGRATRMPVAEIAGETQVEPNHVYVIPPGKHLVLDDGRLHLAPRTELRGQSRPVDHFMRSLADQHGHKAIAVVLSGTANDGTLGLQEVKAGGGITFAQDSTAEQDGMPRSAIASGAVDFVLPPDEIAKELARISRHPYVAPVDFDPSVMQEPAFTRILEALRQQTGVDFSNYKRNTLHRRITRRMLLHKLADLNEYVNELQARPDEVETLYQDVLINVTSFFRNPEAYEALKTEVFPRLTEDRNRLDPLRVWALGCSTGEEAYSLAMAYAEYADGVGRRVPMQIFATDVNGLGIDRARSGVYPRGIAQDVSPDRLRRFFVEGDGSYRIAKSIRDMVVFARQNALTDPPFSRMDFIACRNMLIYLEPVLQRRLIPVLHYALRPGGYMWLGGSETIGTYRDLFDLADAKHKIYLRKPAKATPGPAVPNAGGRRSTTTSMQRMPATPLREFGPDAQREADRLVLSRYAPPGVLLNDELEVVQFRGDTGAYLAPAPGRATLAFLKMLREGLMVSVRGALHKARRENVTVREEGLRVRANGGWREVDVVVVPVRGAQGDNGLLVLFEEPSGRAEERAREMADEMRAAADRTQPAHDESSRQEIARLTQELGATREYLQSVIEQQEAANEELQSANEEVQSANEELQSINEELETSKEEIQSANEELATVNDELQNRNLELSQSNNDLTNLLASVNMAIVMLGPDLRIRSFTQPAEKVLIHADVGRPFSDIKLNLDVPDLEALIGEVIETMSTRELEVQDRNDRWYSLRIRPYRTSENRIDGAVLMLVDIDNLKRAEHSIRESEQRFEVLANSAPVLIWVNDLAGCRFVNRAYEDFVGELEPDIRRHGHAHFLHPEERDHFLESYREAQRRNEGFSLRARLRRADGTYRWMKHLAAPRFVDGALAGYVGSSVDITDMAEAEQALLELDRGKNEFLALLAHELRNPLSGVHNASRLLAESSDPRVLERARAMIDRQTGHMVRMIDDLLDISRITYGKIQLQRETVDVVAALRRTIETGESERLALKQSLVADLPDQPLYIDADPVRMDQLFANLLGNASKFTRSGGRIWVNAEREAGSKDKPAMAVIRVRDNGVGIDAAMLPRIFDLFVQGEQGSERARVGIGLGLTLAKRVVDLHGGSIEAHSAGDALGSEFIVRLPALPAGPAAKSATPASNASASQPRRVLVVDDNVDAAVSLQMLLSVHGHPVRVVHEGTAVVAEAKAFDAEVVVLDIGLPDLGGYDVARAIRSDPALRGIHIVAVTGYGRDVDRQRSTEAGIDRHLTKPVDFDVLCEEIAKAPARSG